MISLCICFPECDGRNCDQPQPRMSKPAVTLHVEMLSLDRRLSCPSRSRMPRTQVSWASGKCFRNVCVIMILTIAVLII